MAIIRAFGGKNVTRAPKGGFQHPVNGKFYRGGCFCPMYAVAGGSDEAIQAVEHRNVWCDRLDEWTTEVVLPAVAAKPTPAGKFAIKCGGSFAKLVGVGSAAILVGVATDATTFDSEDAVLDAFDGVVDHIRKYVLARGLLNPAKFDIVEF